MTTVLDDGTANDEGRRRSRSQRKRWTILVASHLAVAVIVGAVVFAWAGGDSDRSGTLVPNQEVHVAELKIQGEYFGKTPWFDVYAWVPGATDATDEWDMKNAKVEVVIRATWGCLAFGTQSKTFRWGDMSTVSAYDTEVRKARWTFPTTFSNVCIGSYYEARIRVTTSDGTTTAWSEWWPGLGLSYS